MRISLVILFCLFIAVVNAATVKPTRPTTTKAPVRKSAYAYLRTVRGKTSCASGSCPFWERQGRSFVSLRCYAEQYKECTCLHRMCFSSCMFTQNECNAEMVSCLKQICPRCMPASATAMCSVYDSVAVQVANSLSVFACYPCCSNLGAAQNSPNNTNSQTITTPPSPNGGTPPGSNSGLGGPSTTPVGPPPTNNVALTNGGSNNGFNRPTNNVNPGNTNGGGSNAVNAVAPGNGLANNNGVNNNNGPIRKQQTTKRVVTTRRASATTRRASATTRRATSTVRTATQAQKKPQANKPIKN